MTTTDDSKTTQTLTRYTADRIEDAKECIDKFRATLAESPSYAMEWSQAVFTAAARHEVWTRVALMLADGGTISDIRKAAAEEVQRKAHYPSHSTSQSTNIMEQERLAAWANVVDFLAYV